MYRLLNDSAEKFLSVFYLREFLWNTLNEFTHVLLFNLRYKT